MNSDRWTEVTPSQFPHEAEGLDYVRRLLPDVAPFRAWSNFEFRDSSGRWHEVDLLVLGRRRLHLVELKYYSGTLRGSDHLWLRDGHRAEDSPLKLARRKAQRLASRLQEGYLRWQREHPDAPADPRAILPFVQESVFLHHPSLRCALPEPSRRDLFGLNERMATSGLPGISERLLEPPDVRHPIPTRRDEIIARLLEITGIVYTPRRQREVGSWIIDGAPVEEGDGWQDWPAFHRIAATDRARIRVSLVPDGAQASRRADMRRLADAEYQILSRLSHDGLETPRDLVDDELGVGLVYRWDNRFRRLDLWLADHPDGIPTATQMSLIRQVAEAVQYAHRHRVVHRGLTPTAVLVRESTSGAVRVKVGDWNTLGVLAGGSSSGSPDGVRPESTALTRLMSVADRRPAADVDARRAEAFQAPEGVWTPEADRVRLDVFALGALTYYLVAGRPPAADQAALRERLFREHGLDLAVDVPQVPTALRELVLRATRSQVTARLADVRSFLELLAEAEGAMARPEDLDEVDPLEAAPGALLGGRYELLRRLGSGSTAAGLLVDDRGAPPDGQTEADGETERAERAEPDARADEPTGRTTTQDGSRTGPGRPRRRVLRVLKAALDEQAATRLVDESAVLYRLRHPRLVRIIDGPFYIGQRRVLLLDHAGDDTLADRLRGRTRLSLDLLERWGGELLEAVVALDRQGETHRDIKPSNLGIQMSPGKRSEHLVLFDFSSARADPAALAVGTPPYLDPFLGDAGRDRFDSAAERYAAAVTLFEMATGRTPQYGDGASRPNTIPDEATVEPAMFDPSVAEPLMAFFRRALARAAGDRHHTAGEMLDAWRAIFNPVPRATDTDADERAQAARPETPLAHSGLSARALSAVEQIGAETVADLLAVDRWRLTRLTGVSDLTRREINSRVRAWREKYAEQVTGRPGTAPPADGDSGSLPDPRKAAELLADRAGTNRAAARRQAARMLLGLDCDLDGGLDAFASQAELADRLAVTRARAAQHIGRMQDAWAADETCRDVLDVLGHVVLAALASSGGVATVGELAEAVLAALPRPAAGGPGDRSGAGPVGTGEATGDGPAEVVGLDRIAAGLVRLALDRSESMERAAATAPLARRRRGGRVVLLARDTALLDAAEAIGRRADELVAGLARAEVPLVPAGRAAGILRPVFERVRDALLTGALSAGPAVTGDDANDDPGTSTGTGTGTGIGGSGDEPDDLRLVRLAAAVSRHAAASGRGELHERTLATTRALALALAGIAAGPSSGADGERPRGHKLTVQEVRDRFRARFPALSALPDRPRLDALLRDAGLPLGYETTARAYVVTGATGTQPDEQGSGDLPTRQRTRITNIPQPVRDRGDQTGRRLADSVATRSFLALGVAAQLLDRAEAMLVERFGAVTVDVTGVLLDAMRGHATAVGLPWDVVRAADAAMKGSRDADGLAALVARALPAVDAAIDDVSAGAPEGTLPTLLTEAAPLARYGHLARLGHWTDLGVRRMQAVWLLVPQLAGAEEPMVDGRPLPLATPGQFLMLDAGWLNPGDGPAGDGPAPAGRAGAARTGRIGR
ncbi:BREX system serine/threonine kinase PglW [Frankia sp. Cas3]|uniref:BREX system serine/threonine kinase PglW n=1 Tax=Frankia sp. Cas3 TaxID=3073926 RepID=UPI002AD59912|nr:BREX system serine/threonine kinase PglW [Frankia sp. Cas3]